MAFRHYLRQPLRYSNARQPLYNVSHLPPYGVSPAEPPCDVLLTNSSLYTLEKIKNNPELLKPVNCTLLSPSEYDTYMAAQAISNAIDNNNQ